MSVNSYLSNLARELVLSQDEKLSVLTSIDTIKKRLRLYFPESIVEIKEFGSYVRNTILPRRNDENSDVDIMVVFNNDNDYKPQTFLNYLRKFASIYYKHSEIYQSSPTIVLELHHIKFELTPACRYFNFYYIPNGPSEWMYTDPDGFYSTLTQCNKNNSYKIKPVVRLLKYWNINKNHRDIASFVLEKQIADSMAFAHLNCSTYTDYLIEAFNIIKYSTNDTQVNKAIHYINCALEFEANGLHDLALLYIKKVFPED